MKEKSNIRGYLIKSFFITLIAIGILQLFIQAMLKVSIPWIEDALGLPGFLTDYSVADTLGTVMLCLLVIIARTVTGSAASVSAFLSNLSLGEFLSGERIQSMLTVNNSLSDVKVGSYVLRVILLILLLAAIWVLPYVLGARVYARIVTRKVNELEQKRIAKDKEYEQRRNLLLSDVAHDIKTPITTVAGFSKALADGAVPKEQEKEYLDSIYKKSMKISELISLLFEYVKLDSEGYALHKTKTDLSEFLRECVANSYEEFEEKDMNLQMDIPEEAVETCIDRLQFERAVNNILSNTLKHNPEGTDVFVELACEKNEAKVRISDKGVHIEKDVAMHLFDPFVQGDASRTGSKGSGLGLSITKKVVEMHGGKIVLIQYQDPEKYGKVKTFEITIPRI